MSSLCQISLLFCQLLSNCLITLLSFILKVPITCFVWMSCPGGQIDPMFCQLLCLSVSLLFCLSFWMFLKSALSECLVPVKSVFYLAIYYVCLSHYFSICHSEYPCNLFCLNVLSGSNRQYILSIIVFVRLITFLSVILKVPAICLVWMSCHCQISPKFHQLLCLSVS